MTQHPRPIIGRLGSQSSEVETMAEKLTWIEKSKRWRKRYNGKDYYFKTCENKSDREGKRRAVEQWKRKKQELEFDEKQRREQERQEAADMAFMLPTQQVATVPVGHTLTVETPADSLTINEALEQFLAARMDRCSTVRYYNLHRYGNRFAVHVGTNKSVDAAITAGKLTSYNTELRQLEKVGDWTDHSCRDAWQIAKQFVKWLYRQEYLDRLPRNLDDPDFTFTIEDREIELYPVETLKEVFEQASDRTKLYLTLMMNCGFGEKDISDLTPSEVDFAKGTITRVRSKTRKKSGNGGKVPTVTYTLWPETLELLREFGSRKGIKVDGVLRVLVNENSRSGEIEPLYNTGHKTNGKIKSNKTIASAYQAVKKRLRVSNPNRKLPALKLIRKTSSTMVDRYGKCGPYFLGHAPSGVAAKNYIKPDEEEFAQVLLKLRDYYKEVLAAT